MTAIEQVYLARQAWQLQSANADYETMAAGSNLDAFPAGLATQVHNVFTSQFLGTQVLVEFDTRAIGAATSAALEMAFNGAVHPDGSSVQVYAYDFGDSVGTADWVADFSALTLAAEIEGTSIVADGQYEELADVDLLANVNGGGFTRFVVVVSHLAEQVEPVAGDFYGLNLGWGNDDKENPGRPGIRLTLGYDGETATPEGEQPAAEGSLGALQLDPIAVGIQPAPSGRLYATELPVRGLQGVARGQLRVVGLDYAGGGVVDEVMVAAAMGMRSYVSADIDYAKARAGTGITLVAEANPIVGQLNHGAGGQFCYQAQFEVNTAEIPSAADIVTVVFAAAGSANYEGDEDVVELRVVPSIGAWIPGGAVGHLVATAPITADGAVGAWAVDREAFGQAINRSGVTRFWMVTRRFVEGVPAAEGSADSYVILPPETAGMVGPRFTVGYTDRLRRGVQGRPSGTVGAKRVAIGASGEQGEPSGKVFLFPPVTLTGTQPAAAGVVKVRAAWERVKLAVGRARAAVLAAGRSRVKR